MLGERGFVMGVEGCLMESLGSRHTKFVGHLTDLSHCDEETKIHIAFKILTPINILPKIPQNKFHCFS